MNFIDEFIDGVARSRNPSMESVDSAERPAGQPAGRPGWLSESLFGTTVIAYLWRVSFLSGTGPASQVASGSIAAACCARASTVNSQ